MVWSMPGWYDIASLEVVDRVQDSAGIEASSAAIATLVDQQRASGIDVERIIVAGFSQGGVVALHLGLTYPEKLGGILALSCYLPACADAAASPHKDLDIFMAHGTEDSVIDINNAIMSRNVLNENGFEVKLREYAMGHSVCPQQLYDIGRWFAKVFGESSL